ncbi:MAG: glycosyltransferase family 39 protein [Acidobacteriia bacterium]|nr:glycosyltransferase family 39 protein [Terriglobia bacterium]
MNRFFIHWRQQFCELLEPEVLPVAFQRAILGLIVVFMLSVHVWTMKAPALDRTQWKEIDYIEISTNFWHHGFNFFKPEVSWPATPPRVTAMEFPLVPYAASLLYGLWGFNVYTVRLLPMVGFALMTIYIFRLARREVGPVVGLLAALASAIMPLYQSYGRFLFSDSLMVAFSVMTLFHFSEWMDHERFRDRFIAGASLSIALALKLYPLYLLVPLSWIVFRRQGLKWSKYWGLLKLVLMASILPALWFAYAVYLKYSSIDLFYIFDDRKFETLLMLSDPQWYHTIAERLYGVVAGKLGLGLVLMGIAASALHRRAALLFIYLLTILGYIGLVAQANQGASYYQWPIMPPFSFFMALGAVALIAGTFAVYDLWMTNVLVSAGRRAVICTLLGLLVVSIMVVKRRAEIFDRDSARPADEAKWELAQVIKQERSSSARLLTVGEYALYAHGRHDLSPVLYYYAGMQGWSLENDEWNLSRVRSFIDQGAEFLAAEQVSKIPDSQMFLDQLKKHYRIVYYEDDKMLFDLRRTLP